jgi:putative endonuclease
MTNAYYVGQTDDVKDRVDKHNKGEVKSTKPYRTWVLVCTETFRTRREAVRREKEIKERKSRKYIESLISRDVVPLVMKRDKLCPASALAFNKRFVCSVIKFF